MLESPPCIFCKHLDREALASRRAVCTAFPTGIPGRIIQGLDRHQAPYPGDHGIQFEEVEPGTPVGLPSASGIHSVASNE